MHYEVIELGKKINPSKVSFPKMPPLAGKELKKFNEQLAKLHEEIKQVQNLNLRLLIMNHIDSILWFRQDLRLSDNPALIESLNHGRILPIYILDDSAPKNIKEVLQAGFIFITH